MRRPRWKIRAMGGLADCPPNGDTEARRTAKANHKGNEGSRRNRNPTSVSFVVSSGCFCACLQTENLLQPHEAISILHQLRGIVAHTILENEFDVLNVRDPGRRIALHYDDVGLLARRERPDVIEFSEVLGTVMSGDADGLKWSESRFD